MLGNGDVLGHMAGLDRERGIVFNIPPELVALVPRRENCGPKAVATAMRFLLDHWLVDVLTDFEGKCTMVAAALSLIQRTQLPQRPAFFFTAGRRATGKTTAIEMIIYAVTGVAPAAASWSDSREERRKSLHAYFMAGVSYILWDNMARGTQIQCPYIEKACTAERVSDRRLGESEQVEVPSTAIQLFNGNNITTRGDMTSRSLQVRLESDRADPENRKFTHADPIAWTLRHRARILAALYTVLLGNPHFTEANPPTRFKVWWQLVGSAVEHAAEALGHPVSFEEIFDRNVDDDEEDVGLADFLLALQRIIEAKRLNEGGQAHLDAELNLGGGGRGRPDALSGEEITTIVNDPQEMGGEHGRVRQFLWPEGGLAYKAATSQAVGKRLLLHIGNSVFAGGRTLTLRKLKGDKPALFLVEVS
jgi:hypothetical protein